MALAYLMKHVVVSLPMRDGNLEAPAYKRWVEEVVSLPMRDGNWRSSGGYSQGKGLLAYL